MGRIIFWTNSGVGLYHGHMRVDCLLPLALMEKGLSVSVFPFFYGHDWAAVPSEIIPDLQKIDFHLPSELLDFLPAKAIVLAVEVGLFTKRPDMLSLLRQLEKNKNKVDALIYYALDLWEGWCSAEYRSKVNEMEKEIVSFSDQIWAVSPQLCVHLSRKYGRKVWWLPNATRYSWITNPFQHHLSKERVALLVGGTHLHCDIDAIKQLALKYKNWLFYVVGFAFESEEEIKRASHSAAGNLFVTKNFYGEDLNRFLFQARVGLFPGKRNPFSYFGDTSKWYVYHAAGLDVVEANPQPHRLRFSRFYPRTWGAPTLLDAFELYLKSAEEQPPQEPLPIHDYAHRATIACEIMEGKEGYGYAENGIFKPSELVMST